MKGDCMTEHKFYGLTAQVELKSALPLSGMVGVTAYSFSVMIHLETSRPLYILVINLLGLEAFWTLPRGFYQ